MAAGFKLIESPEEQAGADHLPQDTAPLTPDQITSIKPTTPKGISIQLIMDYRAKGLSMSDIAKLLNCSKPNIVQRLRNIDTAITQAELYRKHRADLLSVKQLRALSNITDAALKKQSAAQNAMVFGVLYDKERLERGQSTSNELQIQVVKYAEDEPQDEGKGDG